MEQQYACPMSMLYMLPSLSHSSNWPCADLVHAGLCNGRHYSLILQCILVWHSTRTNEQSANKQRFLLVKLRTHHKCRYLQKKRHKLSETLAYPVCRIARGKDNQGHPQQHQQPQEQQCALHNTHAQ